MMNRKEQKQTKPAERKEPLHADKQTAASKPTRRKFLWTIWVVIGGIAVIEFVAVAVSFLRPRKNRSGSEGSAVIVAGPIDRFEPGSVTAFPKGKFYLARLDDGGFLALSRECTHLGCTVPWESASRKFVCPCHASWFDITGEVLSPPAPRPLDLFFVRIENGIVKVDTNRRIKRMQFHPGQVTFS